MEIRVLTLFDDDDFLPQEEPKKAPGKAVAAKEKQESAGKEGKEQEETRAEHKDPEPVIQPETEIIVATIIKEPLTGTEAGMEKEEEEIPLKEPQEIAIEEVLPAATTEEEDVVFSVPETEEEIIEPAAITEEETESDLPLAPEAAAADEELNKQILTELIQTDYAALIHKEYPFDVQQASVVQKDRQIAVKTPEPVEETTVEEETEEEVFEEVVPLPEWNLDKKYYTIGEVAQLFSVNTSHIRFWTNEFKLKPRTTRKGDRLYSPADIAELRLIHHLVKEKKHTIKGAREKLKAGKSDVNNKLDLKESLTSLKNMLVQIKEQL